MWVGPLTCLTASHSEIDHDHGYFEVLGFKAHGVVMHVTCQVCSVTVLSLNCGALA